MNKWNKFPDVLPPKPGKYLAVSEYKGDRWVDIELWGRQAICGTSGIGFIKVDNSYPCWYLGQRMEGTNIIAWCEIPRLPGELL